MDDSCRPRGHEIATHFTVHAVVAIHVDVLFVQVIVEIVFRILIVVDTLRHGRRWIQHSWIAVSIEFLAIAMFLHHEEVAFVLVVLFVVAHVRRARTFDHPV